MLVLFSLSRFVPRLTNRFAAVRVFSGLSRYHFSTVLNRSSSTFPLFSSLHHNKIPFSSFPTYCNFLSTIPSGVEKIASGKDNLIITDDCVKVSLTFKNAFFLTPFSLFGPLFLEITFIAC